MYNNRQFHFIFLNNTLQLTSAHFIFFTTHYNTLQRTLKFKAFVNGCNTLTVPYNTKTMTLSFFKQHTTTHFNALFRTFLNNTLQHTITHFLKYKAFVNGCNTQTVPYNTKTMTLSFFKQHTTTHFSAL